MDLLWERIPDSHVWWRIADPAWGNPLDPRFAGRHGGRWNPPGSFAVLYLNQDLSTARANLNAFIAQWPYSPEDLRDDTGPTLVGCVLPRRQAVCDAHSGDGLHAADLPATYPLYDDGKPVPHEACQAIGVRAHAAGLRGVRAGGARTRHGDGRELAWFPASRRSTARGVEALPFTKWFRGRAAFGRSARGDKAV